MNAKEIELHELQLLNQAGKHREVIDISKEFLESHPDSAEARYLRSCAYVALRFFAEALQEIQIALGLNPNNADYWLQTTDILMQLGRKTEALEILEDLIEKGLNTPRALERRETAKAACETVEGTPWQNYRTTAGDADPFANTPLHSYSTPTCNSGSVGNRNQENLKLCIGGKQSKDGWRIINISQGPAVDEIGDVRDLSNYPDGSCAAVYASHVLEHVPQSHILGTLIGLRRVLNSAGALYLSVPDLDVLCRLFLSPSLTDSERIHVMRMMFGGQIDEFDFHYVGLNEKILTDLLKKAGFTHVVRVESFGLFEDTSDYFVYGERISLNLIASVNDSGVSLENTKGTFNSATVARRPPVSHRDRLLHFLWAPYGFRADSYRIYELSNAEIVKYARRNLEKNIRFSHLPFTSGRVTLNPDDILLGHPTWGHDVVDDWVVANRLSESDSAHPNSFIMVPWVTVFPESWYYHMPFIEAQFMSARRIIGLGGKYWFDKTQSLDDGSLQARVKDKLFHVNMGVAAETFPYKHRRNHKRGKLLHVSNLADYKNIDLLYDSLQGHDVDLYLASCSPELDAINEAQMKRLEDQEGAPTFKSHLLHCLDNRSPDVNQAILETCDFYLHTSNYDAQATTILENCARGLVPIVTPESGFDCEHAVFLTQDAKANREIIDQALAMSDREYEERSRGVREHVIQKHNWGVIYQSIWNLLYDELSLGESSGFKHQD